MNDRHITTRSTLAIALIYAVVGSLWILLSDRAVEAFIGDPLTIIRVGMVKGWVYVFATSLLLYFLVSRMHARLQASQSETLENQRQAQLGAQALMEEAVSARQHLEVTLDALKESEQKFRLLAENAADCIFWMLPDGGFRYLSPACEQIFGYTPQAFIADPELMLKVIHPDDRQVYSQHVRQFEHPDTEETEYRIVCQDGTERWVAHSCAPIRDENGALLGMRGTNRDITRRKTVEQQILQLSQAVDQSPESIVITDTNARIEYVNEAFLHATGYSRNEVIGQNPRILQSGKTPRHAYETLWKTLKQGNTWQGEFVNRSKDGREYVEHVIIGPIRQSDGTVAHYLAIKEDVTEKLKMSEELVQHRDHLELLVKKRTAELATLSEELRESEARFREVSDAAPVLLWMAGLDKLCFYFNRHWLEFTGRSLEQEMGNGWAEGVHPDDLERCLKIFTLSFDAHQPFSMEYRLMHRSGEYRWILDNGVPRFDGNQNFLGYIGGCTDIELIRRAEAEKEAARNAAELLAKRKGEFLANMSHEIRTPLNGVLGLAQIGYRDNVGRHKAQDTFNRILDSGKLLLTIINDILDFSKIEAGKLSIEEVAIDPARLIEEVVQGVTVLASAKCIRLSAGHDDLPPAVLGDAARIIQVLNNLLSNAIKFTNDGEVCVSASRKGEELHFAVRDTGIGITPEAALRLFQPFEQADSSTTRKFGGTGLGLSISRRLAELMGGSLDVVSTPNQGSTFTLRIPCRITDIPVLTSKVLNTVGAKRLEGMYLLVAEDNAINQLVLEDLLRGEGADVVLVDNGKQAVEMVAKGQRSFNLVLMDVQMPEMDGLEATRSLKLTNPDLPVIGQTAHALKEEHDKCLDAGMLATINKPIDLEILVTTLLEYQRPNTAFRQTKCTATMDDVQASDTVTIDWKAFARRYADRPEFIDRLVRLYLEKHSEDGNHLRNLADCTDISAIERMAHDMKGTAGNLFATELQKQAVITLECARKNSSATVSEARKLANAMDNAIDAFKRGRSHFDRTTK